MPKRVSSITRLALIIFFALLFVSLALFGVSTYLLHDTYSSVNFSIMRDAVRDARKLLERYQAGEVTLEALQTAVNPALSTDGGFFMLLDENQQVLAFTDTAAPFFAGNTLEELLNELKESRNATLQKEAGKDRVYYIAQKTEAGYVLVGRPARTYPGAAAGFRLRLLLSMAVVVLLIAASLLIAARRASKPAKMITEMAVRLTDGEQMTVPENLPGRDLQEIAGALNYMSRTVAKAIQDLKYEKDTMALILEGLNEGILAVDGNGAVLHENEAAWRLLGGEGSPAHETVLHSLLEPHAEDAWEGRWVERDRVLHYAVSRLPGEKDEARGTVALIRDITEEERLERTRHDYVANISHELRTPLSSIRGLGEGLRDGLVTRQEDRQRYYTIITDEANRLSRLVNDLLELSSLQSNPASFEVETVDPKELILDLHDLNSALFAEKGLTFVHELPEAPLPLIRSNEDRLSQALTIFLDNARKYTPSGGKVTLGAESVPTGVRFFVRDTGVGMDEETKEMAFERFHQAERGRSDRGSGLGLAIAREVLQKMGVAIQVESELGKGSEFSFTVPLKPPCRKKK